MNEKTNFEMLELKLTHMPDTKVEGKIDTVARVFGIEHRENYISNWLAFLLDPARFGSSDPLNALIELYFSKKIRSENIEEGKEWSKVESEEVIEVTREDMLGKSQRIDLFISTDEFVIGIESKIYAGLHPNQLRKYEVGIHRRLKSSEHKDKKAVYILLTPESNFQHDEGEFIRITFEEVAEVFSKLHYNYQQNLRSAFLLEDFVNYVNEYLRGGKTYMNEEWANFISSNNHLLSNIYEEGSKNLEALKREVDEYLKSAFTEEEWEVYSNKKPEEFWRQLKNEEWDKYNIHYEVGTLKREPTYGFILPERLKLTLDIENNKVRKYFQTKNKLPFEKIEEHNEITIEGIDYKNGETISQSLDKIIRELRKWDSEFRAEINDLLRSYEANMN
ncbi:PD-(D/E)XK nuclease family protein [Salinicoccus roseus]|uniref:PD-(D/E)XK nuclease family protein n=1 Tax=Salinicoccus roseus TaxID=45670 RepID=UPI003DA11DB2